MPREKIKFEVEVQHDLHPTRWYDLEEEHEQDAEYYGALEYKREFPNARKGDLTIWVKKK